MDESDVKAESVFKDGPPSETEYYDRLRQRRNWLTERIQAKKKVNWCVEYDTSERDALTWALNILDGVTGSESVVK